MNFAKKTMSLALASVMAASSLFVGTTAFAATDKVITPMTGNTQAVSSTVEDVKNDKGDHLGYKSDSSVYSYSPAQTGYYGITIKSNPVYETEIKKTTKYGTEYTDDVYSTVWTDGSKRVGSASVAVYDNSNLSSYYNYDYDISALKNKVGDKGLLEFITTAENVLSYKQKDEKSSPEADAVSYIDGYDVIKLYAGKTYYFDVSTSVFYNRDDDSNTTPVNNGGTLEITPTDWKYKQIETTTASQYFNVNGENETMNINTVSAEVTYVGTAKDAVVPEYLNNLPVTKVNGTENKAITSLTLGSNVKSVSNFNDLKSLTTLNLANVETINDNAFANDTALAYVAIPATVKEVGDSAFYYCTSLAKADVAYGVKEIGDYAFYNTAATSITLPATVVSIGDYALGYEEGLNEYTVAPYDTTEVVKPGFVMSGISCEAAANYASVNDMAYYDISAGCPHPYNVTTVEATIFAKGKVTSVCPICGDTTVNTLKKKTFKISSLKSSKKGTIAVKAAKQNEIAGYQIQYSTSKKFSKKTTKTVSVNTTKALNKSISGLKNGKKYYVRVRAFQVNEEGKTVNSAWTKTKSVKVK